MVIAKTIFKNKCIVILNKQNQEGITAPKVKKEIELPWVGLQYT